MRSEEHHVREIEIDVRKYLGVLKRRWWIILSALFITVDLALLAAFLRTTEYQSEAKLLFESGRQTSSLIGLEDAPQEFRALTSRDDPLDTQVEILRSIPTAEQVIDQLGLVNDAGKELSPQALLANIEVRAVPGTDVLRVGYISESPEEAVKVVDTLMKVYIASNVKSNRSAALAAQRFIENQLPTTDAKVSDAEEDLRKFKETHNIVDFAQESERIVSTLSNIDNNLTQLRSQQANLNSQSANLEARLQLNSDQAYESSTVSQSPAVAEILTRLDEAESELASQRSQYDENHPAIIDLREEVTSLRALRDQRINDSLNNEGLSVLPSSGGSQSIKQTLIGQALEIDKELAGLSTQISELTQIKSLYQNRARTLPSLEKQYLDLERKVNAAKTTHEQLLSNLQEVKVLQNQSIGNARVISPAQLPSKPIGLPNSVYLLGGGLLGLVFGTILAFLVDLADEIHTIEGIQELYEYPLLGITNDSNHVSDSAENLSNPLEQRFSILAQSGNLKVFAELTGSLKSRYKDNLPKTIGITSATRHEGKSAITANFAMTLAQLGHSVIVIDANFSKPSQHHIFNLSNQLGISDVVAQKIPVGEAIQKVSPRLHVLSSGSRLRKASTILRSQSLRDVIQACQKSYDFVLVDTPSIIGRFSSLSIHFIDHFLIVAQADFIKKSDINKAKKMLSKYEQKDVLGLLVNRQSGSSRSLVQKYNVDQDFGLSGAQNPAMEFNMLAAGKKL